MIRTLHFYCINKIKFDLFSFARLESFQTVDLPAYTIQNWNATEMEDMTIKGILVSLTLEHQFFSIFMATYLPTILLNIINQESWLKKLLKLNCKHMQATNYVQGDLKYDMILTLNITSLMVLTSIYLSVSASLPSTSVIKPIEEWLLFNLTYPFMVILVNIAMQVNLLFRKWTCSNV